MREKIAAISVENIFTSDDSIYVIPIYQRSFAWEEEHILKLIEDINDNNDGYFLGNLIVDKNEKENNSFVVIDGQQRLTTLYILYKALEIDIKMHLNFECRESSKSLLENLGKENDTEKWNQKIIDGYKIAKKTFIINKVNNVDIQKDFKEKLKKAKLLQISVPKGTDLNHYFEVMNTRGEQLEKVDILKSKLMKKLKYKRQEAAEIWDVCSNMNEYVIKSLFLKRHDQNNLYEKYFKYENNDFIWKNCKTLKEDPKYSDDSRTSLLNLLEEKIPDTSDENNQSDGHFESLVQFPEFLLHVLNIISGNHDEELRLNKENILKRFNIEKIDAEDFIINLLKYRFYYDMYIGRIKAKVEEDDGDNDDENTFNMRKLKLTDNGSNVYPVRTFTEDKIQDNIRAVQWALRITHTSQKQMYWITEALTSIEKYNKENTEDSFEKYYLSKLENFIKNEVKPFIIENNQLKTDNLNKGVGTPHIIFAYLDYLLQKNDPVEPSDYYYNFRTSVEHLYPQNDNEVPNGQKLQNSELLNNFGNLFLVNRETNSRFSNEPPRAKWERMAEGIPPKLEKAKAKHYPKWADNEIREHCEKMIDKLKEAFKIE
jgi:hypothetical protein